MDSIQYLALGYGMALTFLGFLLIGSWRNKIRAEHHCQNLEKSLQKTNT